MIGLASKCFAFRELLLAFVARDLRGRYIGSLLGTSWAVLQPLAFLFVYYLVFIQILKMDAGMVSGKGWAVPSGVDNKKVAAFLMFCAIIPWIAFTEAVNRTASAVVENGNMIKKILFPSELLPVYVVASAAVGMIISFLVYAVLVLLFLGRLPEKLYLFPLMVIAQSVFVLGLGYFLSAANVFVRDVTHFLPLVLTFWFFLTPIFYTVEMIDLDASRQGLLWIFDVNPMTYATKVYRRIFIAFSDYRTPESDSSWTDLAIFSGIAAVTFVLGYRFFLRCKPRFADEL